MYGKKPPYQTMYSTLFNAVTDAYEQLESALRLLRQAQRDCEELYINAAEPLEFPPCKRRD